MSLLKIELTDSSDRERVPARSSAELCLENYCFKLKRYFVLDSNVEVSRTYIDYILSLHTFYELHLWITYFWVLLYSKCTVLFLITVMHLAKVLWDVWISQFSNQSNNTVFLHSGSSFWNSVNGVGSNWTGETTSSGLSRRRTSATDDPNWALLGMKKDGLQEWN